MGVPAAPEGVGKTALGVATVRARESRARLTAWLAEGLMTYLTADEAERLLTGVSELSAPGCRVAFEHNPGGTDAVMARARQIPRMRQYASLWKGGPGDAPGWLAGHGWRPEFHGLAALGRSYWRPVAGPARSGFLTAVRVAPPPRARRQRKRSPAA